MSAELLLREFERIGDTPDAMVRLRRFVLDLAVRGKLTEQRATDEPASALVSALSLARTKVRAPQFTEPMSNGDAPFSIPTSWEWVRLGEAFDYDAGEKVSAERLKPDRWLVDLEDIESDTGTILSHVTVRDRESLSTKSEFEPGDVLYGKLRPYLNKVVVAQESGYSTTEIVAIRSFVPMCAEYTCLALRRPDFVEYVTRLGQGTKMPRLRTQDALVAPFPLPPLDEQHRIVIIVDELMALCDQLELAQKEREVQRDALRAASLYRMTSADNDADLITHIRFFLELSQRLIAQPEHVAAVRQTILDLAVRGQLVPQDSEDEPAISLLERVHERKLQEGLETGRDWVGNAEAQVEALFSPPPGWAWSRIGSVVQRVTVGYVGPMTSQYAPEGVPFLRSQNVRADRFRWEGLITIRPEFHQSIRKSSLSPGDVVIVRSGNVGTACVIPEELPEANCSDLVIAKNPMAVHPRFLSFFLNSLASAHIEAGTVGMALTHFNTKSVAKMPIPIPPLAEQGRIVDKVDELMSVCDELELAVESAQRERVALLESLLFDALGENSRTEASIEAVV